MELKLYIIFMNRPELKWFWSIHLPNYKKRRKKMYVQKLEKLSFDILDCLDSKDIREFNQELGTVFSPMEQAALVYQSKKTCVEQKLKIWHELLDTFAEDEFQQVQFMVNKAGKRNKEIVRDTVSSFEAALKRRFDSTRTGIIFEARFWEADYSKDVHVKQGFFAQYEDAYHFLEEEKAEYMNDDWLSTFKTKAEIVTVKLEGWHRRDGDIFIYDNELQMIDVYPEDSGGDENALSSVYLRPPLPFKKGDIVRTIGPEEPIYAVVSYDYEWGLKPMDAWKDSSDMLCIYDTFDRWDGKYQFGFFECYYLHIEYCPIEELPDDKTILVMLKDVYQEKMLAGELLRYYCEHGENAYIKLFGKPSQKLKI